MKAMLRLRLSSIALVSACVTGSAMPAEPQPTPDPAGSRAELLYSTHCVTCHTAQIHWRDGKLATNWASLEAQVRRWQTNIGLRWTDADVAEVTRYLNRRYYRFPEAARQLSRSDDADRRPGPPT